MVAFILSNLTGLLRQILVANAFGTQADMEAFNAANRVAETLFALVAGGALASAFIPTFTTLLTKKDDQEAWKLASSIFNLILVVISIASLLAAVFAPQVVRHILAPGFVDSEIRQVDNQGHRHADAKEKIPGWIRMDTDKAAAKLVRAVIKRKRVAVITAHGKIVVFLERHFPWLISFLVGLLGVDKRRHREV